MSSSLYLAIAARISSLGMAPGGGSPLTIIMNRMACLLPVGTGHRLLPAGVETLAPCARRARSPEIDTASDVLGSDATCSKC